MAQIQKSTQKATELRTYETICLTKVDMPVEKLKALLDRAKKAVTENGKGEWLYEDDWGKAKIAYLVKKEPRAQWNYFRFKSEPTGVDELIRGLAINEFVLRQQTARATEDGSDYNTLRATFPKDLADRDKPREFSREGRGRGRFNRDGGGRGDRGDRGGGGGGGYHDRNNEQAPDTQVAAPADSGSNQSEGE